METISRYYRNYLTYLKANGDYQKTNLDEIDQIFYPDNLEKYASIEDVVKVHGKMKALRNFAEFILTGDVNDIHKELETAIDAPEEELSDDFEDMLDFDFDLENPFDDEI
jgi:hypothetical protein